MPSPSDCERLAHILEAIALSEEFVSDLDYDGFLADHKIQIALPEEGGSIINRQEALDTMPRYRPHMNPELKQRIEAEAIYV